MASTSEREPRWESSFWVKVRIMAQDLAAEYPTLSYSSEFESVGTLCDEPNGLTCSYDAARRWGRSKRIEGYNSFEEAAQGVKNGEVSAFFVPGAYPRIGDFIMDDDFAAIEAALLPIPSLVLVGKYEHAPRRASAVVHHAATTPLLREILIPYETTLLASSNVRACTMLLDAPVERLAITNSLCASFYQLHTYKVLRQGLIMPFICFAVKTRAPK